VLGVPLSPIEALSDLVDERSAARRPRALGSDLCSSSGWDVRNRPRGGVGDARPAATLSHGLSTRGWCVRGCRLRLVSVLEKTTRVCPLCSRPLPRANHSVAAHLVPCSSRRRYSLHPCELLPVLTVMQARAGQPSTTSAPRGSGVTAHASNPARPARVLASIAVPMLKLIGLSVMLITIQRPPRGVRRDQHPALTRLALYRGAGRLSTSFM